MHTYWKYVVEALLNVLCGLVLFLAPARKVCVTFLPTIWKVDSMEFPKTGVLQSTNPSDYQASKKRILWLIQESSRCRIDTKEQQEEFGSNCEGREYQCCLNPLKINIYIDLGRGPAERMKRFTSRSQFRRRSFGGCVICCWFSPSESFIINCIKRTQVIWRSYPVPNGTKTWPATRIFLIPNMTRFSFENPRVSGKRNIGYYPIFWVNPEKG